MRRSSSGFWGHIKALMVLGAIVGGIAAACTAEPTAPPISLTDSPPATPTSPPASPATSPATISGEDGRETAGTEAPRSLLSGVTVSPAQPLAPNMAILEDFEDVVTPTDLGFNDFSGNMGAINADYLQGLELVCSDEPECYLDLRWDFGGELEVFTGMFFSLFGLTDTQATFDGTRVETVSFPEHALDLDRIDGPLSGFPPRRFEQVCLRLGYSGEESLDLRLELKDARGGTRYTLLPVAASPAPQDYCWDFRAGYAVPGGADLDLQQARQLVLVIEHTNPAAGELRLHQVWFTMNTAETGPPGDQELLDLVARRAYQYFYDWSSRKPGSKGIPQDRSTFGDLLTVGGVGFALPAHLIAAENGWISREEAAQKVLDVLTVLDDPDAFGPEPVGRIGYKGWFYHFLGVDGRRKLNFDYPETPQDESLNTVELSSIDTSLALMGVLAAQSYFDRPDDPIEVEIRQRAQSIYDRVEWDFMLDADEGQFYLAWKPGEEVTGPLYEIPDKSGTGYYSGVVGDPATLDYYTDEALIVILLAAGSETHPVPSDLYHRLIMTPDEDGLVRSWPGALFTYQFLPAFLDTRASFSACRSINWFENTRLAVEKAIAYAEQSSTRYSTYGPDAWGISAAEGPFDAYRAYGVPSLAASPSPEQDGTVTYYAMLSAASLGDDMRERAISAARAGWARGHWHPRFGLPDAFHADIADARPPSHALRRSGPWVDRALFAIDQGPMLLHLENAKSGLIWELIGRNPNILRGLKRIHQAPCSSQ